MKTNVLACCSLLGALVSSPSFADTFPPVGSLPEVANAFTWFDFAGEDPGGRQGQGGLFLAPDLTELPEAQRTQATKALVENLIDREVTQVLGVLGADLEWANRTTLRLASTSGSMILKAHPESLPSDSTHEQKLFARYVAASPQLYTRPLGAGNRRALLVVAFQYSSNPEALQRAVRAAVKVALSFSLGLGDGRMSFGYSASNDMFSATERETILEHARGSEWYWSLLARGYDVSGVKQFPLWKAGVPVRLSSLPVGARDVTLFWDGVEARRDGSRGVLKASALTPAVSAVPALKGANIPRGKAVCGPIARATSTDAVRFQFRDPRFSEPIAVEIGLSGPGAFAFESQLVRFLDFASASPACQNRPVKACLWTDHLATRVSWIKRVEVVPKVLYVDPSAFAPLDFRRQDCVQSPSSQYSADDFLYL